jgi:HD-like signal output (HDOD) protein
MAEERTGAAGAGPGPEVLERLQRDVRDFIARGEIKVPPYPAVALRVQREMGSPNFGLDQIAHLVASDAALAADVLRCANSSMYRRGAAVTHLTQAVTRIGAQQVMRLLLASGLSVHAHVSGPLAPLRRKIWIEGLASAAVCQELARQRGLRHEEAFALGLLHDFGSVVACASLETILEERRITGAWPAEDWEKVIDGLHVSVGTLVASQWKLPELVRDVIAGHHEEPAGSCEDPALMDVVRTSDQVVGLLSSRPSVSGDDLVSVPGLGKFVEREVVARVLHKIPEFVEAFEMPVSGPAPRTSPIAQPATTLAAGERPVRFGVTVSMARKLRQFTAIGIAPNGLVITGPEPLPEHRLHEATIHAAPGPLRIWAMTRLSRPDRGAFVVEMHPYALSGVERGLWDQIVAGEPEKS